MTRARILVPLLAMIALAACSDDPPTTQMPPDKAKQQVELYAGSTLTASEVAAFSQSAANVTGCRQDNGKLSDPDESFYIQGIYQMIVPAEQQAEVLGKVREAWQLNGYRFSSSSSDGGGGIRAVTGDAYEMSLAPGPPPAMRLLISSPCYRTGS